MDPSRKLSESQFSFRGKFEDQTSRPRHKASSRPRRGRGSKTKLPQCVSRQGNCLEDCITLSPGGGGLIFCELDSYTVYTPPPSGHLVFCRKSHISCQNYFCRIAEFTEDSSNQKFSCHVSAKTIPNVTETLPNFR